MGVLAKQFSEVQQSLTTANQERDAERSAWAQRLSEVQRSITTEREERQAEYQLQRQLIQNMNSGIRDMLSKVGELDSQDAQISSKVSSLFQQIQKEVDQD